MEIVVIIAVIGFVFSRYMEFMKKSRQVRVPIEGVENPATQPMPSTPHDEPRRVFNTETHHEPYRGSLPDAHDETATHGVRPSNRVVPPTIEPTQTPWFGGIDADSLMHSVVMAEVLGKPIALRKRIR